MTAEMFDDVGMFHAKFNLPVATGKVPCEWPSNEIIAYRLKFLREELDEFVLAIHKRDLADAVDALADLAWVALGTAHYFGAPFHAVWEEVRRANMDKVRASELPGGSHKAWRGKGDIAKPPGWQGPRIKEVIDAYNNAIDQVLL